MNTKQLKEYTLPFPHTICVKKNKHNLEIRGALGCTSINVQKLDPKGSYCFSLCNESNTLRIHMHTSFYKTFVSLFYTKITGCSRGFLVYLRLHGSAFRVSKCNDRLTFQCGYSHDIQYTIPQSVHIFVIEQTSLCVYGIEKNQVTQIAATLQHLRFPSVYKGKGIQFVNRMIACKQGKRK